LRIPEKDRLSYAKSDAGTFPLGSDSLPQPGVARGSRVTGKLGTSRLYPDNGYDYWIHVPAGHDPQRAAPVMVATDGHRLDDELHLTTVIENLVHRGELPSLVTVFVSPGTVGPGLPVYGGTDNRAAEYHTMDDTYARFLVDEIFPEVEPHFALSTDPDQRAIIGTSSGGAAAFTAAWFRPDLFRKVVSGIGSFVDILGSHALAYLVRRGDRKPLRVFLQGGREDLDTVFGSWAIAHQNMVAALEYRGYDYRSAFGDGGHSPKHLAAILPDALTWLWRDEPT
jgi:enterochelin esterase family protein